MIAVPEAIPRERRTDHGESKRGSNRPAVLIVDDVEENLFALVALLRRDDVDLLTARSGREALELLLDRSIALAIIDVHMPEMDGFDLAALMRGVEKTKHVPIIFVTAASRDERRVFAGYEAGAVDFLFKPVDSHVLTSKVDVFVTLEKQRQELRKSEERFRTLVETTSQAIWRTDPDGAPIVDSPSFRELTGMDLRAWFEGRWLETVHPDDTARIAEEWNRALASRTPAEFEYRLRRREGHFTWTLARIAPVFDDHGQLVEWIGANTDIDARKEAESVRETFVAILGHDLRNPVAAIQMWTQLVLSRTDPLDQESIRYPLERVVTVSGRMLRMISQLLDLTRVRLGDGIAPAPTPADMEAIVGQALVENVTGRDRFRVDTTGTMTGTWDVDRMYQVVSNLARNALEHSKPGTPIRISLDGSAPDTFQLTVSNQGPPVPANLRDAIFEPFRGSKSRRSGAPRGLGLGLFITKQIVLAHGGTISFETGDTGTTFTVKLPRHTKPR
jgi:PAS domain S-box-containing protein